FAFMKLGDRGRVPTAQTRLDRLHREARSGGLVVETRAEAPLGRSTARTRIRLGALGGSRAGTARGDGGLLGEEGGVAGAGGDRGRGLGVAGADLLTQLGVLVLAHCLLHFPRVPRLHID